MTIEVREYETADGGCPFRDWLESLDRPNVRAFRLVCFGSRPGILATTRALAAASRRLA